MPVRVSFLDLAPISLGSSSSQALQHAVDLAVLADRLGYHRYWFAEHHNMARLGSGSPEIMIAHVASQTTSIRVGSGGVMLPNHSPLRIAEAFRLLEALHPGRIDLGLGRAPGTDTLTAFAMRRSQEAMLGDDYPEQLAELIAFDDAFPADHPFRAIRPVPVDVKLPPLWLLGSSAFSSQLAAEVGLGFAFAAHINRHAAVPALRAYRTTFVPSPRYPVPRSILTVSVVVGETGEHARELARINDLLLLRLRSSTLDRYPTLDEARAYVLTDAERAALAAMPLNYLAGDAAAVHQQIIELVEQSQADEVMITTMLPDPEDRRQAVTALARAFGLVERPELVAQADPVPVRASQD
ncbi:MAG: LLM class flavin-dependent oxidoreductase [Chloroflexota bacterium]|nr:LLM class flavin-dependent oxidoreductase [Chloroflexota bacterium]